MNREFVFHLRSLTRFVYYVTEEEDRFLVKLNSALKAKHEKQTWVFNSSFGLILLNQLIEDWRTGAHQRNEQCAGINDALIKIYREDPREEQHFYIITDPDRYLKDDQVQRRLLNIAHQLHYNDRVIKLVIFVGPRLVVPRKLQRYIEVVYDKGLSAKEMQRVIDKTCNDLHIDAPQNMLSEFKGLTSFEADAAISQSVIKTNEEGNPRVDARLIADFKRRQLHKTDLIKYTDVREITFDDLGGADRFKAWVEKYKAAWTKEGQKFGLKPPKGVLSVGVWGCGKSLGVKVMANAWRLPVVQLEMGKLRNSAVGETEANIYRATNLIEAVAPCVVWMDEAEKSLSGAQSSSQSDAGTTSRALGIFSTWLQETDAPICVAMTANSLKTLPTEFVSRMTEKFFFDMPSNDERIAILKIHLKKQGQNPEAVDKDGNPRYQLAELAEAAKNMVGREIEQAIEAAMVESFHQGLDFLGHTVLLNELKGKPRIYKTMVDELREVMDWVGYDDEVGDGIRAKLASGKRSEVFNQFRVSQGE